MSKDIKYEAILNQIGDMLIKELGQELDKQGHRATGSLINSLEKQVLNTFAGTTLLIKGNSYGLILDQGVRGDRIAYYPNSGRKSSKYITGLMRWIAIKGMASTSKEIRNLAFAIARTQGNPKYEGMPTKNSRKQGKKTGWITDTLKEEQNHILQMLINFMGKQLTLVIEEEVKQTNTRLKL